MSKCRVYKVFLFLVVSNAASAWTNAFSFDQSSFFGLVGDGQAALTEKQPEQALESYLQALKLMESDGNYLSIAAIHNLIGEVYEGAARYQTALGHYERALRIISNRSVQGEAEEITQVLQQLQSQEKGFLGNTGPPVSVDLYRGNIDDLEALLDRPESQRILQVVSMLNAANMYLHQNQFRQADELYRRGLAMLGQNDWLLRRKLYANLAWSAIKRQRLDEADARLAQALADTAQSPPVELRRALLALGVRLRQQDRLPEAIVHLEKALDLYRMANDDLGRCRALAHLATAHLEANQPERAEGYYLQALRLNERVGDKETRWHARGGLARLYHRSGKIEQAVRYYQAYLDTVERIGSDFATDQGKVSFLEDHDQTFEDYVRATIGLAKKNQNYALVRQAIERVRARAMRSLQISRQQLPQRRAGQLPAAYVLTNQPWEEVALADASGPFNPVAQMAPGVPSLSAELPLGDDERVLQQEPASIPQVTFLEYYVLADQIAILVNSPDHKTTGAFVEIDEDTLNRLITDYRRALELGEARGVVLADMTAVSADEAAVPPHSEADIARRLYRLLIKPVRQYLPADPREPVVIVPHQSLWLVPFAALQDEDDGYLGDRHVLAYAASEGVWKLTARRPRPEYRRLRAWIIGDPLMPEQIQACGYRFILQALPGARQEAKAIAHLLGPDRAELFIGAQADRLRLEAWHPDFTVIHLATHGVTCPEDPLSSFVVLTELDSDEVDLEVASRRLSLREDPRRPIALQGPGGTDSDLMRDFAYPGLLDARTVINRFRLQADLITLSACQTGLGKVLGQGNIGFGRALLAAGARSLLVSLWRVDDEATKELMIAFYQKYLDHGNKGLALQKAMRQTRNQYPHPRYWAAFTLMGMFE